MKIARKIAIASALTLAVFATHSASASPYGGSQHTITTVGATAEAAMSQFRTAANSHCHFGYRYMSDIIYDFVAEGVSATATIQCSRMVDIIQ